MPADDFENALLRKLQPEDAALLIGEAEFCSLRKHTRVEKAGQQLDYAYFLESGLVSVIATHRSGHSTEVALIGPEGLTGVTTLLGGGRSAHDCLVQMDARAVRVRMTTLQQCFEASSRVRHLVLGYLSTLIVQSASTSLANARSSLSTRLARWLLMCLDRTKSDTLPLTHELLSRTLGTNRSTVTEAVQLLEGAGCLRARRGLISIKDRDALETIADGFYGKPECKT